jgi:hypothetical protein
VCGGVAALVVGCYNKVHLVAGVYRVVGWREIAEVEKEAVIPVAGLNKVNS